MIFNKNLFDRLSAETKKQTISEANELRENMITTYFKMPQKMSYFLELNFNSIIERSDLATDFFPLLKNKSSVQNIKKIAEDNNAILMPIKYSSLNDNFSTRETMFIEKMKLHVFVITKPTNYDIHSHLVNSEHFSFSDIFIGNKELKNILSSAFLTLPILKMHSQQISSLYSIASQLNDKIDKVSDNINNTIQPILENLVEIVNQHSFEFKRKEIEELQYKYSTVQDFKREVYSHSTYENYCPYPGEDFETISTPHYVEELVTKASQQEKIKKEIDFIKNILNEEKVQLRTLLKAVGKSFNNKTNIDLDNVVGINKNIRYVLENYLEVLDSLLDFKTQFVLIDSQNINEAKRVFILN